MTKYNSTHPLHAAKDIASSQYCNTGISARLLNKVQNDLNSGIRQIRMEPKQESLSILPSIKGDNNKQNGYKRHYRCHLDTSNLPHEPINFTNKTSNKSKRSVRSHIVDFLPPTWSTAQHRKPHQQEDGKYRKKYQYRGRRHNRSVKFNNDITILPIKSYRDYPVSIRRSMWNSLDEIRQNAKRNVIEYREEGKDWRQATEEDCMWYDVSGRDYIHPAHIPLFLRRHHYYVEYR